MFRVLRGGLEIAVRSAAVSLLAGHRSAVPWAGEPVPERPTRDPLAGLRRLAKIAADEAFLASEILSVPLVSPSERHRIADELKRATAMLGERGWLDAPARFHDPPPPALDLQWTAARAWGLDYETLAYDSGWLPPLGLPGRARYLAHSRNHTSHAWILRHEGPPRPWLLCVPGYRMGTPLVDFVGFRAAWLHHELGLNVAIPVLPFHGPRAHGRSGDGFLCGDVMDLLNAQTQAVWDVRRLLATLRSELAAPAIGLYGVSLGGCTTGIVAGLEPNLDCVIAGIPAVDWVELLRAHTPPSALRLSERWGFPWQETRRLLGVSSPLRLPPAVERDRLHVFAARSDRLAHPEQAEALWEHWGRPDIAWYDGAHASFMIEPVVERFVRGALEKRGLVESSGVPRASERRALTAGRRPSKAGDASPPRHPAPGPTDPEGRTGERRVVPKTPAGRAATTQSRS